jgi:hypothetical protein
LYYMKVGDLVRFNKRAMDMKGEFPNEMMLILETTEITLLALNSSTGLIRRQYQHLVEVVSESR